MLTKPIPAYQTARGAMFHADSLRFLSGEGRKSLRGKVSLIFTSPPFPLNRKKRYGNETGEAYIAWLAAFGPVLRELLTPNGSIVMEVGNAWEPGEPVMSTLALRALLAFLESGNFHLCQQFVWNNPAKLPSPAQWVNVKRWRVKDSFTHLWWMSHVTTPFADNRQVLQPYSRSMRNLLRNGRYNAGRRPSEHVIGAKSFLTDNGGAIPGSVLTISNTGASDAYQAYCRERNLKPHPARMPAGLAQFFIKFLTKPRQLVLDPFGGSNTTGAAAEGLRRRWVSIEANREYIRASKGRFAKDLLIQNASGQ